MLVSTVNYILSTLTVIGQAIIVAGVILILLKKGKFLLDLIQKKAVIFAFIVTLIAVSGSLFFSEIAGFQPCKLCWFQRIFMYPQLMILAAAIFQKDKNILNYNIILSIFGAAIAVYNYLLQIGVVPPVSCSVVGFSVDCSKVFVLKFGYITISMMSLAAFSLILFFSLVWKFFGIRNPNTK